jgi:hypothetical protein
LQPEPPPLLRLSSVRPESVKQVSASPILTAAKEKSVESPASSITLQDSDLPSPVSIAEPIPSPGPLPVAERVPNFPPALEPLSAFEGETDAATPGWMDHFTLGRAIGIMLLLTLIAGSSVYHRELGHALVWLGLKIAGEESSESLRPQSSPVPAVSVPVRESTEASPVPNAANLPNIPASPAPSAAESTPTKSTEIPSASQTTVAPQLKDSTTPSLVPLTQVTRSPAAAAPTEAPNDAGQQDYQKALAILRTPNREAELPEAVRLLWSSVEKGNVGAEIALAGLYRTGRGVSRNCAQAKILLATAARKGSADAQKRLEDLQHEGCEE